MNIYTWIHVARCVLLRQNGSFGWDMKLILIILIYKMLNILNQKIIEINLMNIRKL